MSYETISNRIVQILQNIEGVYNVYPYMRDIPGEEEFEKAFTVQAESGGLLSTWMLTRTGIISTRKSFDDTILDQRNSIEIQGIYGMKDVVESSLKFQAIIDAIYNRFKEKFLLESEDDGTVLEGIILTEPPQTLEIGHGQWSEYFVHFCRIVILVEERIQ